MHHFAYRAGVLHAEGVDLVALAEQVDTPFYCYSTATLERHYRVFADAFADVPSLVCYAMKANSNQAVIATLARLGAGADVVSGGELKRALGAGVPPERIMFSGVGKTAVVEGLAQRMAAGDVPAGLQGKRLVALDLGALIAGAKLRGEFIRRAQERRRDFTVDWVHLKLNDQAQRTVLCKDPFRSTDERVEKLIAGM